MFGRRKRMESAAVCEDNQKETRRSPQKSEQQRSMSSSSFGKESSRSQTIGACIDVLALVITAVFHAYQLHRVNPLPANDINIKRQAKLLYVALLDRVQRDRPQEEPAAPDVEWNNSPTSTNTMDLIASKLAGLSPNEYLQVLNEVFDVSVRNLRGPLVSPELYATQHKQLSSMDLKMPVSLHTLFFIRNLVHDMAREEKLCLFRWLLLWRLMNLIHSVPLLALIEEKHWQVFSECSEMEFLTGRGDRHDLVAMDLLLILVVHMDVFFNDLEYMIIRQEMPLKGETKDGLPSEMVETSETASIDGNNTEEETEEEAGLHHRYPESPVVHTGTASRTLTHNCADMPATLCNQAESQLKSCNVPIKSESSSGANVPVSEVDRHERDSLEPTQIGRSQTSSSSERPKLSHSMSLPVKRSQQLPSEQSDQVYQDNLLPLSPRRRGARGNRRSAQASATSSSKPSKKRESGDAAHMYIALAIATASVCAIAAVAMFAIHRRSH